MGAAARGTTMQEAWAALELAPSPDVRVVPVGARTALFSEKSQQLHEINEGAHAIWRLIEDGASCAEIAAGLEEEGAGAEGAARAAALVREWLRLGHLTPRPALGRLRETPAAALRLDVGGLDVVLAFHGEADAAAAAQVFGHFRSSVSAGTGGRPPRTISVVGVGAQDAVFVDGRPAGTTDRERTPPKLKTLLTDLLLAADAPGFWTHAALLARDGSQVLLTGEPGAGKTTLTLALAARGFAYGGDDIVHVDADGAIRGVPFAAAVKPGAWPLLAARYPRLGGLPVYVRPDEQQVRYVLPDRIGGCEAGGADAVVLLAPEGQGRPGLAPAEPMEALRALLESGWSRRHAADAGTVAGLARALSPAACRRLPRCDLSAAVRLVEELARG